MADQADQVGISGFAVYVPPYRVDLQSWCRWTDGGWDKTRAVVGNSFRMRGSTQSVYTLAATAALRLIDRYDVDPRRVGFLGLGTESSTDNSAGAVIVKGMLDEALPTLGRPPLSRHCEVPEVKHACLGGVYALKGALRYLALEREDRCAIVVAADIAEYARGSSGEPTQGAGAVALLLERDPKLLTVHLEHIGSASSYRAVDFRKPLRRNLIRGRQNHFQDLPVFNGKYSTTCYLDETLCALGDMARRQGRALSDYYREVAAVFLHRPYHRMPEQAFALSWLFGLAQDGERGHAELIEHCERAQLPAAAVVAELSSQPDLLQLVKAGTIDTDAYPLGLQLLKELRGNRELGAFLAAKLSLGSELMKEIGNVYSAALPAWMAAGFEDAVERGVDLAGQQVLAMGYGSGDAAEALPMTVAEGWRDAAARIRFAEALEPHQDLTRTQYETLHDTGAAEGLRDPGEGFVIQSIGTSTGPKFSDEGIEYYRFVG
jgi:hydroxymethylglutaryl-CoA synthase